MRTHVALVASATLLTGCWPARFVERPRVSGTVVSAQTHAPIAGARVAVAGEIHSERTDVVTTDANGKFEVRAIRNWALYSPLGERWPAPGFIEVSAEGFVPQRQPLVWPQTGRSRNVVGAISLVRVPIGAEINFVPQTPDFSAAAEEYRVIWREDGDRIADAFQRHTGLQLETGSIQAIVYEGSSYSGDDEAPMRLRASYPLATKRATLVHELGHRLILDLVPKDFEDHPVIFLFVYDVWVDLWGKEFADAQVAVESARRGYDYEGAWREARSLGASARADRWSRFVAERKQH